MCVIDVCEMVMCVMLCVFVYVWFKMCFSVCDDCVLCVMFCDVVMMCDGDVNIDVIDDDDVMMVCGVVVYCEGVFFVVFDVCGVEVCVIGWYGWSGCEVGRIEMDVCVWGECVVVCGWREASARRGMCVWDVGGGGDVEDG